MPPDFNVVLVEPLIPQNTGSIARLCACTGARLNLVYPLGFRIDDQSVKRAGLDYWPHVEVVSHESWNHFLKNEDPKQILFFSKFATRLYTEVQYSKNTYLVFGNEEKGLSESLWGQYSSHFYKVPMRTHIVRSLNLSQCVAVVLYEALRQVHFKG